MANTKLPTEDSELDDKPKYIFQTKYVNYSANVKTLICGTFVWVPENLPRCSCNGIMAVGAEYLWSCYRMLSWQKTIPMTFNWTWFKLLCERNLHVRWCRQRRWKTNYIAKFSRFTDLQQIHNPNGLCISLGGSLNTSGPQTVALCSPLGLHEPKGTFALYT